MIPSFSFPPLFITTRHSRMRLLVIARLLREPVKVKIHQRGVQWKQGVVVHNILQAVLLYVTTPIHCTPLPLHPPLMNTHKGKVPPSVSVGGVTYS